MNFENLLIESSAGYALITVNRPEKLNALNAQTVRELDEVFTTLSADSSIRAVILTGAGGKSFVAGADITEINHLDSERGKSFAIHGQQVFRKIEMMPKPVIAAVNGFALGGGCELAMSCHLRIAASTARFGQPEVNLGIIPGYGGTQRLPRIVGMAPALHLLLTGSMIDAQQALRLGLVNEVVEPDQLIPSARTLAEKLAQQAPAAVAAILQAVYQGMDTDLPSALAIEAEEFGAVCATEDMKEGTTAFLEKRKPRFRGK